MLDFIGVLMFLIPVLIIAALGGIGYFFWVRFRYRTARSNQALIITGPKLGDHEKETNIFTDQEKRDIIQQKINSAEEKLKYVVAGLLDLHKFTSDNQNDPAIAVENSYTKIQCNCG